jgi:SAM-dependent methyltransferase
MQQTVRPTEIVLAAVGQAQDQARRLAPSFPNVVVRPAESADCSAAKSAGLTEISSDFVVFLDADERLTPVAIEAGLNCFAKNPNAWLVCGAHRVIDAAGQPASPVWHERVDPRPSLTMFRAGGTIALQAAVMYRTDRIRSITCCGQGGEDSDALLPIAGCIAIHDCCVAEYRYDKRLMLSRSAVHLDRESDSLRQVHSDGRLNRQLLFQHNAPQFFAVAAKDLVGNGWNWGTANTMVHAARMAPFALLRTGIIHGASAIGRRLPRWMGGLFGEASWAPRSGRVRFGDFGRITPISTVDGYDRGKPIDRHYIERALANCSEFVRGRVLEVGGRDYTRLLGAEKIVFSEVLDIDPLNPEATIICDLGIVCSLPEGAFDCIIVTQTLQYIYDLDSALDNLHRALRPDGTLLITVPGISAIGKDDTGSWYWEFTKLSLRRMLSDRFGETKVHVQSYGNVFAAVCFLTGLSLAEVGTEKLEYQDERYPVTVFACARKLR